MRLFLTVTLCALALGLASCTEPSSEYLPPTEVSQEYLPPAEEEAAPAATLSDDGYRYKSIRRLRFRHRRDVSELNNEYLPPTHEQAIEVVQEAAPAPVEAAPEPVVIAAAPEPEPAHTLADDGYRYKTVKRYRYRIRRDVSELNNEYLPPTQEQAVEVVQEAAPEPVVVAAAPEPEPAHTLADDGYRYKTVKRYRYRIRRDVSELNNEYLPPTHEQAVEVVQEAAPAPVEAAPEPVVIAAAPEPEPAHTLADDGYRYKTVKRYRYRIRRDVSELNNEYLPPTQEQAVEVVQEAAPEPVVVAAAPEPEPAHTLADDGYRYKTVKRYRYRIRRDVSELNNEYLPPTQEQAVEVVQEAAPAPVEAAPEPVVIAAAPEPEPAHTLADDGYRYKTVKRYRYRIRRDVSELNNEYLPPTQEQAVEVVQEAAPAPVAAAPEPVVVAAAPEPEPAHTLADDGYRYKAVKRYRYRIRRDVSELNNEYLPPTQEVNQEYLPPVQQEVAQPTVQEVAEPEPAHALANDGYRYKSVKRYRFRHRRDVSEINNEYLPPTQEVNQEYLPPVQQEVAQEAVQTIAEPEPAHALSDDGYRYKAIRRVVYRRRV